MKTRLYLLMIVIQLACTGKKTVSLHERTFTIDDSFSTIGVDYFLSKVDSLLNQPKFKLIDSKVIAISESDTFIKLQFSNSDTIQHYLTPSYEVFLSELKKTAGLRKMPNIEIVNPSSNYSKTVHYQDTVWLATNLIAQDRDKVCLIEFENPVTDKSGMKAFRLSEKTMNSIYNGTDTVFYAISLNKNSIIIRMTGNSSPINYQTERELMHTAKAISDHVFHGWETSFEVRNNKNELIKRIEIK